MKYTPRELKGNVNVRAHSPLRDLATMLFGVLLILVVLYAASGYAVGIVVERMPEEFEDSLASFFTLRFGHNSQDDREKHLQGLLDSLSGQPGRYRATVMKSNQANAAALPGGTVLVLSQLLLDAKSENEVAFVLGHEIGHFKNRDHLRGLGRALVLTAISYALLGSDSSATDFFINRLANVEMRFSQMREKKADQTGIDLLYGMYGHVGGATGFLKKRAAASGKGRFAYFFASHPYPPDRIAAMELYISQKKYPVAATVELPVFTKPPLQ